MLAIPAIDLMGGKAVRLSEGDPRRGSGEKRDEKDESQPAAPVPRPCLAPESLSSLHAATFGPPHDERKRAEAIRTPSVRIGNNRTRCALIPNTPPRHRCRRGLRFARGPLPS